MAAVAVLPVQPPPEHESVGGGTICGMGLRLALTSAAMSVACVPLILLFSWATSQGYDQFAADGVDVRQPGEVLEGPVHLSVLFGAAKSLALVGLIGIAQQQCFRVASVRPPRRAVALAVGFVVLQSSCDAVAELTRQTREPWVGGTLVCTFLFGVWLLSRDLRRLLPPQHGALARTLIKVAAAGVTYTFVYEYTVLPLFFDHGTSDSGKLFIRLVVHTLLTQLVALPMRRIARQAGDHEPERLLLPFMVLQGAGALMGRAMMLGFASGSSTAVCILGVSLVEMLTRATMSRVDRAYVRLIAGRTAAAEEMARSASRRVQTSALAIDELFELWATVASTVLVLALRLGDERAAPDPAAVVLAGLLQLAAEVFCDMLPPLLAQVVPAKNSRIVLYQRAKAARLSRALRGWPRAVWLALVPACWAVLTWYLVNAADATYQVIYCAWSRGSNGLWHRVPCGLGEAWIVAGQN